MTNQFVKQNITRGHLYWVGSRFSDCIPLDKQLTGSICLYGISHDNHIAVCDSLGDRVDNNDISAEVNAFIRTKILEISETDKDAHFCFYNPCWKYDIGGLESVSERLLGINKKHFYDFYGSKVNTRQHFSHKVPMLEAHVLAAEECQYNKFEQLLGESEYGYILQADVSSGGLGTLIINDQNKDSFREGLTQNRYILSKYHKKNIPVNYHAVIYADQVLVLPGSIQILRVENNHLVYKGADYVAYQSIDKAMRQTMIAEVQRITDEMRLEGYRGVVGIDCMIVDGRVYVVEVNTRHQGSTAALNIGLAENGFKSVQEMHMDAFCKDAPDELECQITDDTQINHSCYSYNNVEPAAHAKLILERAGLEPLVSRVDTDGYTQGCQIGSNIYRFRLCFATNICSISPDSEIWIHQNVSEPSAEIYQKVLAGDPLAIKITLMTQGMYIEENAKKHLTANGGIREGNNNAVDLFLRGMVINAPCDVAFNAFAPYSVRLNIRNSPELYYYDKFVDEIKLYPLDPLSGKKTKSGRFYADIAYLSTDRLRVHMTNKCIYKKRCQSCRFCNITTEDSGQPIPMEDIIEVVEDYLENAHELRHFLVGGQSAEEHSEKTRIVEIIKAIRERTDKHIYVMSLPFSKKTIREMSEAGMTELACNIEIYDDTLAAVHMPGKGKIKRRHYIDVLSYAAGLYEKNSGVVRSALILGLEPHKSFMAGVLKLIENNIQPIISVFRPLPGTPLEKMMMPPAEYLYRTFIETEMLCRRYNLSLGPACINCQNNTLSLPDSIAIEYLNGDLN